VEYKNGYSLQTVGSLSRVLILLRWALFICKMSFSARLASVRAMVLCHLDLRSVLVRIIAPGKMNYTALNRAG